MLVLGLTSVSTIRLYDRSQFKVHINKRTWVRSDQKICFQNEAFVYHQCLVEPHDVVAQNKQFKEAATFIMS
jgi:hypothetical protein